MPRTRITEENSEDISFLKEQELNDFFGAIVITGTENSTEIIQPFGEYHHNLDNLVHNLAETQRTEIVRGGPGNKIIGVEVRTVPVTGTLIRSTSITRSMGKISQIIQNQHDAVGTIVQTLTSTINRSAGGKIISIDVVGS